MKSLTGLKEFRNRAYCLLGNGKDGLFDLMDAVMTCRYEEIDAIDDKLGHLRIRRWGGPPVESELLAPDFPQ